MTVLKLNLVDGKQVIPRLEVCAAKRQNAVSPEEWVAATDASGKITFSRKNQTKETVHHYFGGQCQD